MNFATRVRDIEVSLIKQMPMLARDIPDVVSLGQGIPSFSTPQFIRDAVCDALQNDSEIGKYSLQPGMPALKVAIAEHLMRTKQIARVDAEREIVVTCGAMEGLAITISALVEPGDEVILCTPCYSSHIEQVRFAQGIPVFVALDERGGWQLHAEDVARAITPRTKAIVVCSPSNPTGAVFAATELQAIAQLALQHGFYVICDDAYDFLTYDDTTAYSLASFADLAAQCITVCSFSKLFCMTGWRVGYVYAPANVVEQLLKVHDAFAICAPTISQYAALAGLRECNEGSGDVGDVGVGVGSSAGGPEEKREGKGDKAIRELRAAFTRRRDILCDRLSASLSEYVEFVRPQGSYFVFPRVHGVTDSFALATRILHEARVVTIPGSAFGPSGEGHLRLSFGADDVELTRAMDRLIAWFRTTA